MISIFQGNGVFYLAGIIALLAAAIIIYPTIKSKPR